MKRIMGTLLVARAIFLCTFLWRFGSWKPQDYNSDLYKSSHNHLSLESLWSHEEFPDVTQRLKEFLCLGWFCFWTAPPQKKNSDFVLVILKSGEFLFFTRSSSQGCFKSRPEDSFCVVLTTQAIKKTLHFEFMNSINFPRKSASLLLNHSLGRDNHTSHPWRRENTALL